LPSKQAKQKRSYGKSRAARTPRIERYPRESAPMNSRMSSTECVEAMSSVETWVSIP
jgi:hypothetical protein